jgi:hypothetical protein
VLDIGVFYLFYLGAVVLGCCSEIGAGLLFCGRRVLLFRGRCLGVLLFNKKTVLLCFGVLLYSGCCYFVGVVISVVLLCWSLL